MALWDFLNNSDSNSFDLGGSNYNPTQSNVLGQDLAPTNFQGEISATDPENDSRVSGQLKQDAQNFQNGLTNTTDEDDKFITSKNGNKYEKVDDSPLQMGLTAAASYMSAYLSSGGNVGVAAEATGQATYDLKQRAHRLSQIDKFEDMGGNPLDGQAWITTGDKKYTTFNKGSWTSAGNGQMFNTATGEIRSAGGMNTAPVKTVDLGDRKVLYFADGSQQEVAKGATPKLNVAGATSGGIGIDEDEAAGAGTFQDPETGLWMQRTTYANGREKVVPLGATTQKALQAQQNAGQPTATQTQMSGDINTLQGAIDSNNVNSFTGQVVGRMGGLAQDVSNAAMGNADSRAAYQATQRIQGYMQNQGVGAAKAMGLSGINTIEEAKRAFASMPQLDMTSPENLNASLGQIKSYVSNYNSQNQRSAQVKPQGQQSQSNQLSDDELLKKYGG